MQMDKYIVFYLSPADYHRIHSPIDGTGNTSICAWSKIISSESSGLTIW